MYREGEAGAVVAKGSGVRASDTGRDNGSRNRRIAGLGFGGVLLVALLSGCDVGAAFGGFGWPQGGITPQSQKMYDLWIGSVVAALVVGVFVWGLIFWCVIRYRKRGEELPPQTRFNMPMEVLYTVTPVLVVCVLFYYTAIVQTNVDNISKDPDVTVEVVAFKWNWQFNYLAGPGEDAEVLASTIGSTDEIPLLVLPTGQKIRFEETSRDVIHSFWVPELLFKRDVLPGSARNVFEVTIDTEGRYVGRCAELCGTYHSMMNFELVSVDPGRYQQFLAAKQAGQSTPEAMATIGFTGDDRFAITTFPFETKRDNNNFSGSQAEGEGR
ncbi:aa3-type cytochrome oxidase subunit II [Catenuloplanes nepalensis]|uniref:aa3-type cytochrome oxidase subunit II n=1 Tax=Catenuloplanes nepalensis TaxID=587533 RepID=UPI0035216CBE